MIALLYFFIINILPSASRSTYHDTKTNTIILQQDIAYFKQLLTVNLILTTTCENSTNIIRADFRRVMFYIYCYNESVMDSFILSHVIK